MSGKRVNILKNRAKAFLDLARELIERGQLDLASFSAEQASQLRVKATLLRLLGEIPRIHSIRELLGLLAKKLEEMGYSSEADAVSSFVRENRGVIINIESAYTESRYGLFNVREKDVREMLRVIEKFFKLLEVIENAVLG